MRKRISPNFPSLCAKKQLDFEPGTEWQYSNTNYVIAGRIAEIAGGKPLIEQLQERIFRPLNMTGVFNSDASRLPANDPLGYYQHALGPLAQLVEGYAFGVELHHVPSSFPRKREPGKEKIWVPALDPIKVLL